MPLVTLLTRELLEWVGAEVVYTAPEEIGRAAIRYFARAVGDDNPVYGDVAPPTLVVESVQYMDGRRNDEGYAGHTWPLPIPEGYRTVRGGNEYTFGRAVRPDDRLTVAWRLRDITEKRSMIFVVSEVTYRDQLAELLATNIDTVIYVPPSGP